MQSLMKMSPALMIALSIGMAIILLSASASARQMIGDAMFNYQVNTGLVLMAVQMTPAQARVIDPVLTTVAQGYKNAELVGNALFPVVPVDQRGGKIITFGKEDFQLYNTGRAPGAATKRVQFGHQGSAYALEQHSLEGMVPFEIMEEANEVPGIDMGKVAVMKTQNIIGLRTEYAQAALATNAGNYASSNKATLSGTDQFSNASSKPGSLIAAAVDAVRAKVGKRANTVLIGATVFAALKNHPEVIDRIKFTGRDVVTAELLASLWDVKRVVVGDAVTANDAGTFSDVWGKFIVVAYTELGSLADMGLPSFGYTYRLRGNPTVEVPYQERNAKSWIYPVTDELSPVIAAPLSGFLYSAAVA